MRIKHLTLASLAKTLVASALCAGTLALAVPQASAFTITPDPITEPLCRFKRNGTVVCGQACPPGYFFLNADFGCLPNDIGLTGYPVFP